MPAPGGSTQETNMSSSNPSEAPDKSSEKKRRYLSAEKKFQIYLEAQDRGKPVGEILRYAVHGEGQRLLRESATFRPDSIAFENRPGWRPATGFSYQPRITRMNTDFQFLHLAAPKSRA